MAFANRIGSLLKQNARSTPSIYHTVRCVPSVLSTKGVINSTTDKSLRYNNIGEVLDDTPFSNPTSKRRGLSSFSYEEDVIISMTAMDQKGSSLLSSPRMVTAIREFCSKLLGNSVNGFDLGTVDSCIAVMEAKKDFGVPNDSVFEMNDNSKDGSNIIGRQCSGEQIQDELGNDRLSLMWPKQYSKSYHQGLVFLSMNGRRNAHVRCYSSGGRNTNFGPKRTKFAKQFKGRMKGKSSSGTHISFGRYALQALQPAWVTARQIEAGRRAMSRHARSGGKIWVRVFPDKPITGKPAETRMGRGKGAVEYWTSVVKPGRILYEMDGVSEAVAKSAISLAAFKMPIKTRFIKI